MGEIPLARELQQGEPVSARDRAHRLDPLEALRHPSRGAERAVVAGAELVRGADVVVEEPAVVDDAREHVDPGGGGRAQRELAGPRLERAEDQHRPVDQPAETLEAADHVECEPVGRPGATPIIRVRPASRSAAIPLHTASLA